MHPGYCHRRQPSRAVRYVYKVHKACTRRYVYKVHKDSVQVHPRAAPPVAQSRGQASTRKGTHTTYSCATAISRAAGRAVPGSGRGGGGAARGRGAGTAGRTHPPAFRLLCGCALHPRAAATGCAGTPDRAIGVEVAGERPRRS
jgi:hypothetical protein